MSNHCIVLSFLPCTQLPSQQALTEGVVPPFYANKVQLSYSVDNAPTHIFLCILATYLFVASFCMNMCTCICADHNNMTVLQTLPSFVANIP